MKPRYGFFLPHLSSKNIIYGSCVSNQHLWNIIILFWNKMSLCSIRAWKSMMLCFTLSSYSPSTKKLSLVMRFGCVACFIGLFCNALLIDVCENVCESNFKSSSGFFTVTTIIKNIFYGSCLKNGHFWKNYISHLKQNFIVQHERMKIFG